MRVRVMVRVRVRVMVRVTVWCDPIAISNSLGY